MSNDKETFNPGDYPAFPMYNELGNVHAEGLTKREYFAAMAMQGLLANDNGGVSGKPGQTYHEATAVESILLADALLNQLTQDKKNV